jgi:hypothetical protein
MAAVRKELDEEYEAAIGLNIQRSKDGVQAKYPAILRLDPMAARDHTGSCA